MRYAVYYFIDGGSEGRWHITETVKGFSLALCGVFAVCAGVVLIFPQGRFKKMLYYITGLAALLCVFGAAGGLAAEFDFNTESILDIDGSVLNLTESQAAYTVKEFLKEKGINAKKVLCYMDNADGDNISIIKAQVYTDAPEEQIKQLLEELNIKEVEVFNE